jgi:hypothetical protein
MLTSQLLKWVDLTRELQFILAKRKPSKTDILFAPQLMSKVRTARFLQLVKLIIAIFVSLRVAKRG